MLYLPLWYYILREARVKKAGNKLGPVGSRILTDTFVKILIQDEESILRKDGGFSPSLPSTISGKFEAADLIKFSGVNKP